MQLPPTVKSKDDLNALMRKLNIKDRVADLEITRIW